MIIATKIILLLSTITSGLTAGLFWGYAYSVMPALRALDDRILVAVMNKINTVIVASGWFWLCFGGGLLFAIAALIMVVVTGGSPAIPMVIIAAVVYLLAMIVTSAVNIPLNNLLAGIDHTAEPAILAATRERYEGPWIRANAIRAALHTIAFIASSIAVLTFSPPR